MEVVWLLGLQVPWRCPLCRDYSARYTGKLAVTGTRDMVLLVFFLASGGSAPVRTNCGGNAIAWIVGPLAVMGMQGILQPQAQQAWCF